MLLCVTHAEQISPTPKNLVQQFSPEYGEKCLYNGSDDPPRPGIRAFV